MYTHTLLCFPGTAEATQNKQGGNWKRRKDDGRRNKLPENSFFKIPYTWLEERHKPVSKISVSLHLRKVKPFP